MTAKIEIDASTALRRLVTYERRSTELSTEDWEKLESIAKRLGLRNVGGPRARQPSWRVLLRAIAQGSVKVSVAD